MISLFLVFKYNLLVKRGFLLNAAFAMAVLNCISCVDLAKFVITRMPQPYHRKVTRSATDRNITLSN
jgi:hypothetical protein